jgi:hypothetical protein
MELARIIRHLSTPQRAVHRAFSRSALKAIEEETRASETRHRGQIRFAVESALDWPFLFHGVSAAARARDVFANLRIWDTEENNGVLIYLLLADRDVEIVADRGVHTRAGTAEWEAICRRMETAFRAGQFEAGVLEGVAAVTEILIREYPATGPSSNSLSDRPAVMG